MKYLLLIFIFCFNNVKAVIIPSKPAKDYLGVIIGGNYAKYYSNIDYLEIQTNLGYNLGLQYEWNLGGESVSRSGVDFRILYQRKNIEYEDNHPLIDMSFNDLTEKNDIIQIATLYFFKFIKIDNYSLQIITGPYSNYFLNEESYPFFNVDSLSKFELGFSIGTGFEYNFKNYKLGIEYSYQIAFSDKYQNDNEYLRNNTHLINLVFTPKILF